MKLNLNIWESQLEKDSYVQKYIYLQRRKKVDWVLKHGEIDDKKWLSLSAMTRGQLKVARKMFKDPERSLSGRQVKYTPKWKPRKDPFVGNASIGLKYHEYLSSDSWVKRSSFIKERDKGCVLCNSKQNLNVHHRSYRHKGLPCEKNDLVTLCKNCHSMFHMFYDINKTTKRFEAKNEFRI